MQIGDYIEVKDSILNKCLLKGKISKITNNPAGYSIDDILFVNPNSKRFIITKLESSEQYISNELDSYITYLHNNIDNTFEYDFFMWNEIEPEVKEICALLNQIEGIETYSSCSGHGKIPPYVDFYVYNWDKFLDLLDFLYNNKQGSKTFKHNELESKHRFIIGVESRKTIHLESLEINSNFNELCEVLKKYIKKVKML